MFVLFDALEFFLGGGQCLYDLIGVSSCVGRTECWPEYKSLRKQCINLISTPINKYDQSHPGKIFNFAFQCTLVVEKS